MNHYTKLARQTIETYIRTGKIIEAPEDLPSEMLKKKAGVFVTIHTKDNELRGCIGTFLPTRENIAHEIISNAAAAATRDPRFSPISESELDNLEISVDVLSVPEPINDIKKLDPKKYGVLIQSQDGRGGLLLPDLEGVETIEKQLSIVYQKAGIDPLEKNLSLFRFTIIRYRE